LVPTRAHGPSPEVTKLDDEPAEAAWVANAAGRAIEMGTAVSEIAVLYRFNATQARFEAAFARAGIPTVVAEDGTFFDREEVRAVLVPFGQAARKQPDLNGLELLVSMLSRTGFDCDRPPSGQGAARARWESQNALLELFEAWPPAKEADARSLLSEVNALAVRAQGPRTDGVTLATLHKAKGLEWDVVFIVGVADGAMPAAYAETPAELAEEERLLHVGVTRARRGLQLTWPASNPRGWPNRRSRYLDRLTTPPLATPQPGQKSRARPVRGEKGRVVASRLECPHCARPLKGVAARRLGVCPHCVTSVPGGTGQRARALASVVHDAAQEADLSPEELVGLSARLRLLDQRPGTADGVAATAGVGLRGRWAEAAVEALKR
jgi:DNA helicase II / ATP-dependent DNA helicase PcrA